MDRTYGKQFSVISYEVALPATVYGIQRYLGSGLVKGIGKVYSKKIVDAGLEGKLANALKKADTP